MILKHKYHNSHKNIHLLSLEAFIPVYLNILMHCLSNWIDEIIHKSHTFNILE